MMAFLVQRLVYLCHVPLLQSICMFMARYYMPGSIDAIDLQYSQRTCMDNNLIIAKYLDHARIS